MSPRELIDATLIASGWDGIERLDAEHWIDCQPDFETAHYLNGFAHDDGKFHFAADWPALTPAGFVTGSQLETMPSLPEHWAVIEEVLLSVNSNVTEPLVFAPDPWEWP